MAAKYLYTIKVDGKVFERTVNSENKAMYESVLKRVYPECEIIVEKKLISNRRR